MNKEELKKIIENLSIKRPLFHSEADFQHELALLLGRERGQVDLRLERPYLENVLKFFLDILVNTENEKIGIELKYVTNSFPQEDNGEMFNLKTHGNYGGSRFNFLKDVYRLDQLKERKEIFKGFAIILTNVKDFYSGKNYDNRFKHLYLYEGRKIKKGDVIKFVENTTPKKFQPFKLENVNGYHLQWKPYGKYTDFKYLM